MRTNTGCGNDENGSTASRFSLTVAAVHQTMNSKPTSSDIIHTSCAEETRAWAAAWIQTLAPGTVVALHGDLGAGKTCVVQGMAEGLGIAGPVTSPTFTIIHEYASDGKPRLIHIDAYRLAGEEEAEELGMEDYMTSGIITAVEWPERIPHLLPPRTLHVHIAYGDGPDDRILTLGGGEASRC